MWVLLWLFTIYIYITVTIFFPININWVHHMGMAQGWATPRIGCSILILNINWVPPRIGLYIIGWFILNIDIPISGPALDVIATLPSPSARRASASWWLAQCGRPLSAEPAPVRSGAVVRITIVIILRYNNWKLYHEY